VATALGESLQRSEAEKARHESEAKSKALSTVSHEMRNPLNAMLGFSNLVRLESYVKDMQAITHDYVLMGLDLKTDEEYAGMG